MKDESTTKSPTCPACKGDGTVTRGTYSDGMTRLVTCERCGSLGTIKPPSCFVPRPQTLPEARSTIERLQTRATLWAAIPVHIQGLLARYFRRHLHPGSTVQALLSGRIQEFHAKADEPTLEAELAITSYLYEFAPKSSWGDEETVSNWLARTAAVVAVGAIA